MKGEAGLALSFFLASALSMRLGLITCSQYELPGPEDDLLLEPLARLGITGIPMAWDAAAEHELDAVLVRSVWNYWHHPTQFLNWLEDQESRGRQVLNRLPVIKWNLTKRYLCDLEQRGIEIVPTVIVDSAGTIDLPTLMVERAWPKVMIKPMIGGDAHRLFTVDAKRAVRAQSVLDKLAQRCGALIQPIMPTIREGEWSLTYFDHQFSHAIRKIPKDGDYRAQEQFGARVESVEASQELRIWAVEVLDQATHLTGERFVYARVDAVIDAGRPYLMELELIDPLLWLSGCPESKDQFARAIADHLESRGGR